MVYLISFIQIISILTQFAAVALALRLIRITRAKKAWLFISGAIFLMALRRTISFLELDYAAIGGSLVLFESVGLITSVLMVYGVAYIAPVLLELKRSERILKEAHDELERRVEERTIELTRVNEALMAEVTERKQVEEALKKSEEKYRELVENANSIILRLDTELNITFCNEFAQQFFGYEEEEMLGRNVVGTIIPTEDSFGRDLVKMTEDLKRHPEWFAVNENENMRKNGDRVWVAWTNRAVVDETGLLAGILSIGTDISARKQAEEALRTEIAERRQIEAMLRLDEARLEALWQLSQMLDSSADHIMEFCLEQQVKLTRSKIGWIGLMSRDETTLTGITWSKSTLQVCSVSDGCMHLAVADGGVWADAVRERRAVVINDYSALHSRNKGYPTGHLQISRLMVIPVFEGDRIVAIAAVGNKEEDYNPSDARQLTLMMDGMWKLMQRERAEKALRESGRLAAMGRAMSAVAHDMKTPLIAIGGFTHLVQRHLKEGSSDFEKLGIVVKETERLERMVRDMLDFSRPLELERSLGNICQLVAECLTVIEPFAREREVVVSYQPGHDIPSVSLDSMRMKQVLINLLINAVQASPKGEKVVICCRESGGILFLEVIDCGCGIPREKRDEIFSPFFTTKKEGTGLGLPIVKKIVEAHQGYIEILDNPEQGVTFRVAIPIGQD